MYLSTVHNRIKNFKDREYYIFLLNRLCKFHQDLRANKLSMHDNSIEVLKNKINSYNRAKHKIEETYGISNEDNSDW